MKLTLDQFEEAAYIFERANGFSHTNYEKKIIAESELRELDISDLEDIIVNGLDTGLYNTEYERVVAYWSLYKIGNPKLKTNFKKWLELELKNNQTKTLFQLLVALDSIGEKAFHKERTGRTADEIELNVWDATEYLKKNSAQGA